MDHTFQISDQVLFQTVSDEAVLLNLTDHSYYGLNEVATRMWQLLAEHGQIDPVVDQLVREYDVDAATLRDDLMTLLAEWESLGMVHRVSRP